MEAHICVVQTAASLIEKGFKVFVVLDATASRTLKSEPACIVRLNAQRGRGRHHRDGRVRMAQHDWHPAFKKLLPLTNRPHHLAILFLTAIIWSHHVREEQREHP